MAKNRLPSPDEVLGGGGKLPSPDQVFNAPVAKPTPWAVYDPQINADVEKTKEVFPQEESFGTELYNSLARGSERLGSMLAKTPAMVYDLAAQATDALVNYGGKAINAVAGTNLKTDYQTTSEGFSELLNLPENKIAKYYDDRVKAGQEIVAKKYDKGIVDYFSQGEYKKGFELLANSVAESAPISVSIMMGNAAGVSSTASILGAGTAFAADKKAELDEKAPNLPHDVKMQIAVSNGLFEGIFEQFGITKLGGLTQKVLLRDGKEAAMKIAEEGFKDVYAPITKKYIGSSAEEAISEAATQFAQNAVDKYSGYKPDLDLREGVADAAITGLASGAAFGAVPSLAESSARKTDIRNAKLLKEEAYKKQSDLAYKVVMSGDDAVNEYKSAINDAVDKGDMSREQADKAIFKVDAYNNYSKQAKDLTNLDEAQKKELFESSFNIDALKSEVDYTNEELEQLDPIARGKINAKKELIKGFQKTIDKLVLENDVKAEAKVPEEVADKLAKEREKKVGKKSLTDVLSKFKPKESPDSFNPQKPTSDRIPLKDLTSDIAYKDPMKAKKSVQEHLKTVEGNEIPVTIRSGQNQVLTADIGNNVQVRFAQSAPSSSGADSFLKVENIGGNKVEVDVRGGDADMGNESMKEYYYDKPAYVKRLEIDAYNDKGEPVLDEDGKQLRKAVLPIYNKENGKFIGFQREHRTGGSRYTPKEVEQVQKIIEANFNTDEIAPFLYKEDKGKYVAPPKQSKWEKLVEKAVSEKELDAILDQADKAAESSPELITAISKKREGIQKSLFRKVALAKPEINLTFIEDAEVLKKVTGTVKKKTKTGKVVDVKVTVAKEQGEIKAKLERIKKLLDCIHGK